MSLKQLAFAKGYEVGHRALALAVAPWVDLAHRKRYPELKRPNAQAHRALAQEFNQLLQEDLAYAQAGAYPESLLTQFPVVDYLRCVPLFVKEVPRIWRRSTQRNFQDLGEPEVDLESYPEYYRRTFHWQSGGWLSEDSARLYDFGVELLFAGTADIMRRMALPHLTSRFGKGEGLRLLDVACGTGRFLKQASLALPKAKFFGLDLSPYYIRHARTKVLHDVVDMSLVAENAEDMGFRDDSFDALTSVFLFHELPSAARLKVLKEMRRVLKPGGVAVVVDSRQVVDGGSLIPFFENFPVMYHEPFYAHYLKHPLEAVAREAGFEVLDKKTHFFSKVLVIGDRPGTGA